MVTKTSQDNWPASWLMWYPALQESKERHFLIGPGTSEYFIEEIMMTEERNSPKSIATAYEVWW